MTDRLYYDNAYRWSFEGTVTAVRPGDLSGRELKNYIIYRMILQIRFS